MAELLTSAQNPKFKRLAALREKSRLRRDEGVFVVEGRRELEHCAEAGFEVETVFVCRDIFPGEVSAPQVFELSKELYAKVAYREGTEGVMAIVKSRDIHY